MKRLFVIGMALAFTLGIAGLAFPTERGTMKHEDVKICGNVNCCGDQSAIDKKEADDDAWKTMEAGSG